MYKEKIDCCSNDLPSAVQMKEIICSEKNAEEKQAFAFITDILRILLSNSGKESGLLLLVKYYNIRISEIMLLSSSIYVCMSKYN